MNMLGRRDPAEVYRRVDFNARAIGGDPSELVRMCYEQLIAAIGSALLAQERGDNERKSQSLTRAVSALTALQLGVSGNDSMAQALLHIYTTARRAVLDSVLNFDSAMLQRVRQDFIEIAESMNGANQP
jgi:flagellar biosynthetic protein FliS